jgi:hypothetical protein
MKIATVFLVALAVPLLTSQVMAAPAVTNIPSTGARKVKQQVPHKKKKPTFKKLESNSADTTSPGLWPCFDALDRKLIMISIPMIINFSITPLVGANDLFWTNRMGNALAVAGQAAATQVFNSGFWVSHFLFRKALYHYLIGVQGI